MSSVLAHSFPQRFHQAFGAEVDAFLDVVEGKGAWRVTEEEVSENECGKETTCVCQVETYQYMPPHDNVARLFLTS